MNLKRLNDLQRVEDMSNLKQVTTGLPVIVWVSLRYENYKPRIKVQNNTSTRTQVDNTFSLTIEDSPAIIAGECKLSAKILNQVKEWVVQNRTALFKLWNDEIDTVQFVAEIKK